MKVHKTIHDYVIDQVYCLVKNITLKDVVGYLIGKHNFYIGLTIIR